MWPLFRSPEQRFVPVPDIVSAITGPSTIFPSQVKDAEASGAQCLATNGIARTASVKLPTDATQDDDHDTGTKQT